MVTELHNMQRDFKYGNTFSQHPNKTKKKKKNTYAKQQDESHETCQEHFHLVFQLKEKMKMEKKWKPI